MQYNRAIHTNNIEENKMKIRQPPQMDNKTLFLVGQEIINSFSHVDSAVTE